MITIYADLNCPFCYALNEWVYEADLSHHIDWQLIEHDPFALYSNYTSQELIDLTDEVFTIHQRAPDVKILLPKGRCSTYKASSLLNHIKYNHPHTYIDLRLAIYRAYWAEDKNIEDNAVLSALWQQQGLTLPNLETLDNSDVKTITEQWKNGPFERRLPVIQRGKDDFFLGLNYKSQTMAYLQGIAPLDKLETKNEIANCEYSAKPILLLVGSWPLFVERFDRLRDNFETLFCFDVSQLEQIFLKVTKPDIVVIINAKNDETALATVKDCLLHSLKNQTPLIYIGPEDSSDFELKLYKQGCNDVLNIDKHYEICANKIHQHVNYKQTLDELLSRSNTDSLTQLCNRRAYQHGLDKEWANASRSKHPLSIVMIDIDYFKRYNDHFGHLTGDACLRQVAQIIRDITPRISDLSCRIGGEEFALILPNTSSDGAQSVGQRLLDQLAEQAISHPLSNYKFVSVSIGIATACYDAQTGVLDIVQKADEALYGAKRQGRNCLCIFSDNNYPSFN